MASGSQTQADGDKCFTELTACWDSAEEFSRLMEVEQRDSQKGANGLIKPSPSLVEYRRSRYQRAASAYKLVVLNLKKYKKDNSLSEAIIYRKSADHKRRDPGLGELLDRVGLLEGDFDWSESEDGSPIRGSGRTGAVGGGGGKRGHEAEDFTADRL